MDLVLSKAISHISRVILCGQMTSMLLTGRKNGQDARWLQQVRKSGTTSDKVAALTLLLQESAVANLRSLDALLNWVLKRKGGRNVVAQVQQNTRFGLAAVTCC